MISGLGNGANAPNGQSVSLGFDAHYRAIGGRDDAFFAPYMHNPYNNHTKLNAESGDVRSITFIISLPKGHKMDTKLRKSDDWRF